MRFTVDRIEEGFAVLERDDLTHIYVKVSLLPSDVKEGSLLEFDGGVYTLLTAIEHERRELIIKKQRNIFKRREK